MEFKTKMSAIIVRASDQDGRSQRSSGQIDEKRFKLDDYHESLRYKKKQQK